VDPPAELAALLDLPSRFATIEADLASLTRHL
jgi:hypothetical protein